METEARAALERAVNGLAPDGAPERRLEALEALAVAIREERDRLWSSAPAGPRLRSELGGREDYQQLVERIERLAGTDLPALIEGGAGAELVALAIHQTGSRRGGPLVRVQGHDEPCWADVWAKAHGGTVLLLEVGALSEESQAELLALLGEPAAPRLLATSRWDPSGVLEAELAARLALRLRLGPRGVSPQGLAGEEGEGPSLEAIEEQAIAARLQAYGWQQQRTADSLGIDRKTLYRKIRRYRLRP